MQHTFPLGLDDDNNLMMGSTTRGAPWPKLIENLGRTYFFHKQVQLRSNMVGLFEACALYEEFTPTHEDAPEQILDSLIESIRSEPCLDVDDILQVISHASLGMNSPSGTPLSPLGVKDKLNKARSSALAEYFESINVPYKRRIGD